MLSNREVAYAWARGEAAHNRHLRTDGLTLWSYRLPIGVTLWDGRKAVLVFMRETGVVISATTSKHVAYARRVADMEITNYKALSRVVREWQDLAFGSWQPHNLARFAAGRVQREVADD